MGGVTVLELIRSATTVDQDLRRRPELRAAGTGALTALAGLCAPVVLVLLAALAVPRAAAGVGESIGAGALLWLVLVPGLMLAGVLWWRFIGLGPLEWLIGLVTARHTWRRRARAADPPVVP